MTVKDILDLSTDTIIVHDKDSGLDLTNTCDVYKSGMLSEKILNSKVVAVKSSDKGSLTVTVHWKEEE